MKLSECTTYELLNELTARRIWFYCWSPETISADFYAAGIEQPTDDEKVELCEQIHDEIDERFFVMAQELLRQMRYESSK